MEKRNPNWEDVAKLLLLCAPKDLLAEFELTEATAQEWAALFEGDTSSMGRRFFVDTFSLALYYGNKTIVAFRRSYSLVANLYVSPEVLHSLVGLATAEEFDFTFKLKDELARQAASCAGKKRVRARHDAPDSKHMKTEAARKAIRATWANGNFANRDACAEQEYGVLDVSYSVARKALDKTPDPSPWPAKKQRK